MSTLDEAYCSLDMYTVRALALHGPVPIRQI